MTEAEQALPELSTRQESILSYIVRAYSENPEPVSSKRLVDDYNLGVSSATVRNEMARLEELGLIVAPHTSAGRIPTALGYRYFVKVLIEQEDALTRIDHQYISSKFNELPPALDQWLRQAATVLARTVHTASLVTPPLTETSRFKHLELISLQGRLSLLVLVLQGGAVHQRMLTLAEPVSQTALSEAADHINSLCHDLSATQIRVRGRQLNELERDVAELAAELMERSVAQHTRLIYRDGLSEIINAFPDGEGAQQAVRVYEERAFLDMILNELIHPLLNDDVQVIIAGDGHNEIRHLSMVLAQYGLPGKLQGALGVLGPTNLNYGRAISAVRHVSSVMTDMLTELYYEDDGEGEDATQADDSAT